MKERFVESNPYKKHMCQHCLLRLSWLENRCSMKEYVWYIFEKGNSNWVKIPTRLHCPTPFILQYQHES